MRVFPCISFHKFLLFAGSLPEILTTLIGFMWYIAKGLQIVGLIQVLIGLFIGFSEDNLRAELKIAIIGVAIFAVGRLMETRFSK